MEIFVPVSVGELLDKITILKIKKCRILDVGKNENIALELAKLLDVCRDQAIAVDHPHVQALQIVNEKLWDIEDRIREKENLRQFDAEFVELARQVYHSNDRRFELKKMINQEYGSKIVEEKSYKKYQ